MANACRFLFHGAKRILVGLAIIFLVPIPVFAAQESFPFLAEAINERVNVRAGQSQNFEKLCQLDKGEEVVVVGKDFSWYKVQLPSRTHVYVSDKYVRLAGSMEGEITGERVNVRSSAKAESTILGQIEKGARIRVIEKLQGWYKIAPPAQVFGWVSEGLVTFKSRDITAYRPKERVESPVAGSGKEASDASQTQQLFAQAPGPVTVPPDSQNASVTGVLRLLPPRQDKTDVSYELLIRNKPAYFIQGPRAMLDDFARYTVTIDGALNAGLEKQFLRPVLTVTRVQLVL
ncbi:MAG TPA: hypothetical protein DE315_02440 [Candidatus Omnitrophica bacterium]|nr:hypothetical protein [Candidatus Omnitrophota bacterium]